MRVNIKPLSANDAWKGRRFKSKDYEIYERELFYKLPNNIVIPEGNLAIELIFGMSKAMDWDNPIKSFVDVLQKKYNFNDNRIMESKIKKVVVSKGKEFIDFNIQCLA